MGERSGACTLRRRTQESRTCAPGSESRCGGVAPPLTARVSADSTCGGKACARIPHLCAQDRCYCVRVVCVVTGVRCQERLCRWRLPRTAADTSQTAADTHRACWEGTWSALEMAAVPGSRWTPARLCTSVLCSGTPTLFSSTPRAPAHAAVVASARPSAAVQQPTTPARSKGGVDSTDSCLVLC
jgi:hypothetical protein